MTRLTIVPPVKQATERRINVKLRKRLEAIVSLKGGNETFFAELKRIAKENDYAALGAIGINNLSPQGVLILLRMLSENRQEIITVVEEDENLPLNYEAVIEATIMAYLHSSNEEKKKLMSLAERASMGLIPGSEFSLECEAWKPGHFQRLLEEILA